MRWRSRLFGALAFGVSTGLLTHFSWIPSARANGIALTLAAGLAHAVAGATAGPRLLDPTRTRSPLQAALVGACTSLLALALFAPAMAAYVSATNAAQPSSLAYVVLTLLTGLFAFLGAGWALLLLCAGVAVALHGLVARSARRSEPAPRDG